MRLTLHVSHPGTFLPGSGGWLGRLSRSQASETWPDSTLTATVCSATVAGPCSTAPVSENSDPWQGHASMHPSGATVLPMCVQVESRATTLPPLCVISRVRPVGSLTETEVSVGILSTA